MSDHLKRKVLSGLLWRGLELTGTQGMQFLISLVLARLLLPKDFGTIALISVFIEIASVIAESGFGSALIQKKDITAEDYCSVFYFNLMGTILFYVVLFFAAPGIAAFYDNPVLVGVLRVLALSLVINAIGKIQATQLAREMNFKLTFKVGLAAVLASGAIGIGMAYAGFGLWSLIAAALGNAATKTLLLWFAVGWRPQRIYSWPAIRTLFGYSSKLLGSRLLNAVFGNIYTIIIGKLFNPTALGFYNRGQSLPAMLVGTLNGTISGVMFSAFSSCQEDRTRVRDILRRTLKTTTFFVFPALFGLAATAKPLVLVLLTEKWLPCVPYVQIACITFAFWPIHVVNLQAVTALGRSDIFLTLEIVKKAIIVVAILITAPFGIMAMVIGQAATSMLCTVINAWPNRRLLGYTIPQQMRDVLPTFMLAAGMGLLTWGVGRSVQNAYLLLGAQIGLGLVVYLSGALLFRFESAAYLLRVGRQTVMEKFVGHA